MMTAGKNIKFNRIKKGWTQEELASGIISISYLSKIENEQLTASPEIIDILCQKLGIQDSTLQDKNLNEEIKSWYQLIINRNPRKSKEIHSELLIKMKKCNSFYTNALFNLISIRYYLISGQLEEAKKLIKTLSMIEKELTNDLLFFFYKFRGNFEYLNNNYEAAYSSFKYAESLFDSSVSNFEQADVYYSLGLITFELQRMNMAISYTSQALELFRGWYILHRCCDCHLLLGILYQRIKEYDDAKSHYQWASKLAQEVNYQYLYSLAEHNFGYLHYIKNEYTIALHHFENSLKLKENKISKLKTIICIIKIFYKQNNEEQLSNWIAEAHRCLENHTSPKSKSLSLEYKIFKYLAKKDYDNFICFTTKTALPYFEENKDYQNSIYYSNILAEYFKEKRLYKKSSFYFEYCKNMIYK
ncbi:helix-turn-helix transcriptional regulator [Rummeliibacillus stabekisii]|uniref:helix-turn-helix transcriptional regulator n=1 Tax=Rummeliibacillus stabekisii TaxID=241244 RepID=UPI001173B295|nr:helix-turn-helix transcriptional regulator [Rummeliibacillus stabekisii]MBB5171536.1 transcriptional regulator with XRE-family HTH domain [Rummeliibacillus stabekisii]GEL05503.1 transcriptional regulator [Rummeliibacillus stabekisii]